MSDLPANQAADAVKVVGNDSATGLTDNVLDVDANGKIIAKLNDASGSAITSTSVTSNGVTKQRLDTTTVITNSSNTSKANVTGYGHLRVGIEPSDLLYDKFDGNTLDPNTWTSAVSGSGSIIQGSGNLSLSVATAANSSAILTSIPSFEQRGNVFLEFGTNWTLESGTFATNTYRFWGIGTSPAGGSTYANPIQDGVGFEIDTSGNMNAVVYSNGAKIFSQAINVTDADFANDGFLNDGKLHRYSFFFNTQFIYWYIDNKNAPVATSFGNVPQHQILPIKLLIITNPTTAPNKALVFANSAIAIADRGRNNTGIKDTKYPWRGATVLASKLLAVAHPDDALAFYGKGFKITTDLVTILTTTETAVFLIVNPSNSGKTIKIAQLYFGVPSSNNTMTVYRVYIDPTITSNGTALTAVGMRQNNQNAQSGQYFVSPTITTTGSNKFGVHRAVAGGSDLLVDYKLGVWIEPGHSLLVTATTSATALTAHVSCFIYED